MKPDIVDSSPQGLLAELRLSDYIINAMLNSMTIQQKAKVQAALEAAGVTGAGMTRANERQAVIEAAAAHARSAAATPAPSDQAASQRKLDIEARACDINAQALDAGILLQAIFEKLDDLSSVESGPLGSVMGAINCFTTCAARNAKLISEAAVDIVALTRGGGGV